MVNSCEKTAHFSLHLPILAKPTHIQEKSAENWPFLETLGQKIHLYGCHIPISSTCYALPLPAFLQQVWVTFFVNIPKTNEHWWQSSSRYWKASFWGYTHFLSNILRYLYYWVLKCNVHRKDASNSNTNKTKFSLVLKFLHFVVDFFSYEEFLMSHEDTTRSEDLKLWISFQCTANVGSLLLKILFLAFSEFKNDVKD